MVEPDGGLEARFTLERERGGIVEEPPFNILVLGDWTGDAQKPALDKRRPLEIDRDNFDDVMRGFASRLDLQLPDAQLLTLEFRELDDFHPDKIFEKVALFGRLRDIRHRLLSPDTFNDAARDVRSWFHVEEPKVEAPASGESIATSTDGLLDAILSGSTATAPKPTATGEVAALIRDLVRPHLVSVDENEQAALIAAVDAATSDLMRRILQAKNFKKLEASWRGLYLMVRRVETSPELKIFLLNVSKEELASDLRSVSDLSDSLLFDVAVSRAIDTPGAEPWSLIVGDYSFRPDRDDVAALMRLGKVAAAANAPFISHIRPEVLGVSSLERDGDPARWMLSDDSESAKLWTILRGVPEAEFLGLTIPRFLSRLPYGRDSEPLETFQFEEFDGKPAHDDFLWSNSCFIAAVLIAQSFSTHGWEMDRRFLQDIERLPMYISKDAGETVYQPCAETLLIQNACEIMMEHGLMPLVSYKNTDHVKLARFQSVSDPVTALRGRWSR